MTLQNRKSAVGILLAAPILAGILIFFFIPFCITVRYSVTFGVGGTDFVGFSNYKLLLQNDTFCLAIWNTFRFMVICIPLVVTLSLMLALPMQRGLAGATFFQKIC